MTKEIHPCVKAERKFYENMYKKLDKKFDFSDAKKVLDFGSGTGGFASILAEKYPEIKVIAVDNNKEAVKLGRKHYKHLSNLKFRLSKNIPREKYDIIFKNLVLHELNGKGDKETIKLYLKKSYNSLKKQGKISVLDNRKISKKDFRKIYEKNTNPHKGSFEEEYQEHNRYTVEDWVNMLESAGFKTGSVTKIKPNLFHYVGKKE